MKKFLLILIIAVSFGMVSQANALDIGYGDSYYLGLIVDSIPSSEAAEAGYINDLITLAAGAGDTIVGSSSETYNRVASTLLGPFPTAVSTGAVKEEDGSTPGFDTTFDASGFQYILGKYDASGAGALVWYLGGGVGEVTLPSTFSGNGLSHLAAFNPGGTTPGGDPVPEPTTILMVGIGLLGVAFAGRKKLRK